jgi:hypothetical protein
MDSIWVSEAYDPSSILGRATKKALDRVSRAFCLKRVFFRVK